MSGLAAVPQSTAAGSHPQGTIIHIVLFKYAPHVAAEAKHEVAAAFLALKEKSRLPDGSTFIQSIDGGVNSSPEGLSKGLEHAYVVTFRSAKERDYYLDEEPEHQAFKQLLQGKVSDITVFDFESGDFARRILGS